MEGKQNSKSSFFLHFIICPLQDDEEQQIQQSLSKTMLNLIENLPVELVGTNVLGYLDIRDIVMLERTCGCKESHQLFRFWIQSCPPVVIPSSKFMNI